MEYTIVWETDMFLDSAIQKVTNRVNLLVEYGWTPIGSHQISNRRKDFVVSQTMIKED